MNRPRLPLSCLPLSSRVAALAGAVALLASAVGGCAMAADAEVPDGVTCGTTKAVADPGQVRSTLADAGPGTCVVATGSVDESLTVPAGVTLVAAKGTRIKVKATSQDAAISLGENSGLVGVDVQQAAGIGIAIRAGAATVANVRVSGAKSAAMAIACKGAGCASGTVALSGVKLTQSGLGLWVSGAHVTMKGGASSEHASESLSGAAGLIAQSGARVELSGVTIAKNQGVGVLLDGPGTSATIEGSSVSDNSERGVWAQRIAGTLTAPALVIRDTQLVRNRIVGFGGVESRGIIIVGGRIAETVAAPVVTNMATTEQVGDGVGILGGSTDFKIDGSVLEQNARAAGIVDQGSKQGIIIVDGRVSPGASGLKFVVQNTPDGVVKLHDDDRTVPQTALGVSAPKLSVPSVLP